MPGTPTTTVILAPITSVVGSGFAGLKPGRFVETRSAEPVGTVDGKYEAQGRLTAGRELRIDVAGRGGVPVTAAAVSMNATVVNPSGPGSAVLYPCAEGRPDPASNINYIGGDIAPNAVLSKIDTNGQFCAYSTQDTDLVIDINGALT